MTIRPILLAFFLLALFAVQAQAQLPSASKTEEATTETPAVETDPLERDTPRGTLKGFLASVSEENFEQASQYLDLSGLSRAQQARGSVIAQNLQRLLDRQGWMLPDGSLSVSPEGNKEDELEANFDRVAALRTKNGEIPIEVQRITTKDNKQIWLFASSFVDQIPELSSTLEEAPIDKIMLGGLQSFKIHGASLGHWIVMLGLYIIAYLISGYIVRAFIRLVRRVFRGQHDATTPSERHLIDVFETPLRLYTMVWIAALTAVFLGISVIVRHTFMPIAMVLAWVAIGLFFWRLVDLLVSVYERRMARHGRYNMTSMLSFVRRAAKFVFVIIVAIMILSSLGVDVTAGLAALGIGGIALALGAQKTLENFIGSLSIIADQPFHVGDFCKIGEVSGTVEDIGMRSTRLRTNDRTVVTIPNGDLSTQRIENFARRTRFLINRTMVLRYDSKPDQIRAFVEKATAIFNATDKIVKEGTMIRFLGFSSNGYEVQMWANVETGDYNEYVAVQSDITLQVIDAAWECGLYFAIPSQTFLPARDQTGVPVDNTEQAANKSDL